MILVQNFVCISQFCNWNLLVYIVETEAKTYFLQTTNVGDNDLGIEHHTAIANMNRLRKLLNCILLIQWLYLSHLNLQPWELAS